MQTCRLFNVLVVGGFALAACNAESVDSRVEAASRDAAAGDGSHEQTGSAGTGGTAQEGGSGGAGAPDASTGPGESPVNTGGTAGAVAEDAASGLGVDAGDGAASADANLDCVCTASPIFCDGVCCMWMFGQDAPCCDKF